MTKRLFLTFLTVVMTAAFSITTLSALEVPKLKGRVNDYADVLSSREEKEIEEILAGLERNASAQTAVLTIPSLEGDSLEGFSIRTVDEWKLGTAKEDNGVLILLAMEEKQVRIEVGYGLEGELTDAKSGYIIREIMVPYFQKGDFGGGLLAASRAVAGVVSAETEISQNQLRKSSGGRQSSSRRILPFNFSFFTLFILFGLLRGIGRTFGRRRYYRRSGAGGLGSALFWGSILGSAGRRGSHRGGGFGSGGGFGGFSGGGGGFGGGGASGGW